MKSRPAIVLGAIFALAIAAPAFAQYSDASAYPAGYPANYPWFNNNDAQSRSFQRFLASDPQDARDLAANPQMIYDRNWRMRHPRLEYYLQNHLDVWNWLAGFGAPYQNQWHDAYWWHQNQRDMFWQNYPQWGAFDPAWQNQDGAYNQQQGWHYGEWWYGQNPSWV